MYISENSLFSFNMKRLGTQRIFSSILKFFYHEGKKEHAFFQRLNQCIFHIKLQIRFLCRSILYTFEPVSEKICQYAINKRTRKNLVASET